MFRVEGSAFRVCSLSLFLLLAPGLLRFSGVSDERTLALAGGVVRIVDSTIFTRGPQSGEVEPCQGVRCSTFEQLDCKRRIQSFAVIL